jgi:hypothetical protein
MKSKKNNKKEKKDDNLLAGIGIGAALTAGGIYLFNKFFNNDEEKKVT